MLRMPTEKIAFVDFGIIGLVDIFKLFVYGISTMYKRILGVCKTAKN